MYFDKYESINDFEAYILILMLGIDLDRCYSVTEIAKILNISEIVIKNIYNNIMNGYKNEVELIINEVNNNKKLQLK